MARALASLVLATCLIAASPPQTVSVLYAGSLVTPMEGPIARALARQSVAFQGEARGSQVIVNFVAAGLRRPDVVIVVGTGALAQLSRRGLVAHSWLLGSASLGIGWTSTSREKRLFASLQTGSVSPAAFLRTLDRRTWRIARTDPRLDPKGRYTIDAVRMLVGAARERRLLGADDNPAQIFPEEDLLVRLETGEADLGFVYSTEARARGLRFVPLPGRASMSNEILYFVVVMKAAPHPAAARAFVDFLLHGDGRAILARAGLTRR